MSGQLLVDTDVLIDFLRGQKQAVAFFKSASDAICFSAITVAEVYSGIRSTREETELDRLFSLFPVLPATREIARLAGQLVGQYGKSHSVEIPDAIIAASTMVSDAELQTLNVRHYPMLKNLAPPYKKS